MKKIRLIYNHCISVSRKSIRKISHEVGYRQHQHLLAIFICNTSCGNNPEVLYGCLLGFGPGEGGNLGRITRMECRSGCKVRLSFAGGNLGLFSRGKMSKNLGIFKVFSGFVHNIFDTFANFM